MDMKDICINGYNYTTMDAMKYWSFPSSYDPKRRREETYAYIMGGNYIAAQKRDGIWAMIIRDLNGEFHLRARSKNVNGGYADKAEWIPHITKELDFLPNGTVLLGEIYKPGDEGSRKTTAIINCLLEKSLERQKKTPLTFYCFDCIAYKNKNIMNEPIVHRINTINEFIKPKVLTAQYIEIAEYYEGQKLWDELGKILSSGGEGIVLYRKDAPYSPGKRTARMTVKVKKEIANTIDAFLDGGYKPATKNYTGKTDLYEWPYWVNDKTGEKVDKCMATAAARGEAWIPITRLYYMGAAGSLSFSVMKDGKPVHIGYISGVPDEMKLEIVNNPEKWINKVFELTCMEIECIDGMYSMRHGKVLGERTDKLPEDCEWSQIEQ